MNFGVKVENPLTTPPAKTDHGCNKAAEHLQLNHSANQICCCCSIYEQIAMIITSEYILLVN